MSEEQEKLQKKQLFAQRVTAASTAVTAVAAVHGAATLEKMRQAAQAEAEAAERHRQEITSIEQSKLSIAEKRAQKEDDFLEFQRNVLFLKESDDSLKLDFYADMVAGTLVGLYTPMTDAQLPEECQISGSLTQQIKLAMNRPAAQVVKEAQHLLEEREKIASHESSSDQNDLKPRAFLACLVIVIVGTFLTIMVNVIFGVACLVVGCGIVAVVVSKLNLSAKLNRLATIQENGTKLMPSVKEAANELNCQVKSLREQVESWRLLVFTSLTSHFEQNLSLERFTQELKAAINMVQNQFPTSCRVDVEKLQPCQISSSRASVAKQAAVAMCDKDILKSMSGLSTELAEILQQGLPNASGDKTIQSIIQLSESDAKDKINFIAASSKIDSMISKLTDLAHSRVAN